jgi:AcrR family transcriptional regulator
MGLREEKKHELRQQIRSTALTMFGQHGVHRLRVSAIAARLRISEATLFNYFPSKQAIVEEAVADMLLAAVRTATAADATLDEQMRVFVGALAAEFSAASSSPG